MHTTENTEQCQDNCKCSLNVSHVGVAHSVMVNPSPHPGCSMEQALLGSTNAVDLLSAGHRACGWQQENRGACLVFKK